MSRCLDGLGLGLHEAFHHVGFGLKDDADLILCLHGLTGKQCQQSMLITFGRVVRESLLPLRVRHIKFKGDHVSEHDQAGQGAQ